MKQFLFHIPKTIFLGAVVLASSSYQTIVPVARSAPDVAVVQYDAELNEDDSVDDPPVLDDPPAPLPPIETPEENFTSPLIIKAINPGYTVDGKSNVGELIELQNLSGENLPLASYAVRYTNSNGNSSVLISFADGSMMTGEYLLMRYARAADSEAAEATYMTTIAMASSKIELMYDNEVVDMVCWASKSDVCAANFSSSKPTTLVRDVDRGIFTHETEYLPHYDSSAPTLFVPTPPEPEPDTEDNLDAADSSDTTSRCRGLEFTELLSYYESEKSEQFIELYNPTDQTIELGRCSLRYKNKTYALSGRVADGGYYVYSPFTAAGFTLTKNPTTSNTIELLDADGSVIDLLVYNHGQKKSTTYAKFYDAAANELWALTYALTPGSENIYQEFRSCPTGKVINPDTGNCVNATSTTVTECPEGKYRNPLTGRCKNIESTSTELKPCADGYERNPDTNRCRKITTTNDGANYALVPATASGKTTFVALGAVLLLVSLGVGYIILQFRREIARAMRKIRDRLHHIRKDLVARGISFRRHK